MLIVHDVSKKYGRFSALENIHLEFHEGIYGLLAPNGAGKTTLIKMLVTLIAPTEGEVLYNGTNIVDLDEEYRDLIGYLPQQFGYYKHYTPTQFLLYLAALKGIKKKEALVRIADLLDQVALSDVAHKKMRKFSGGMIQRVGIAQALLNNPKVIVLDEPTAGLDPKERARFRQLLTELARKRIVIISTHIVSDIESIANEVIMIKNQRLLYKDSVPAICETLRDRVYETTIPFAELEAFRQRYTILAERQERGVMHVRFVGDEKSGDDWQAVTPHLEDVFLHEYKDTFSDKEHNHAHRTL